MEEGDLISRKEILEIFKSISSKGGAADKDNDDRRGSVIKKEVSQKVWVKNDDYDDGCQDNAQRPFYRCIVTADSGAKCSLQLATDEECQEAKFKNPFEHDKELIMDYSDMADKGIDDMIDIDELNHATILWNLFKRYSKDEIYTYVGPTLLAVNPFKNMSHKYPTDQLLLDYKQISNAKDDFIDVMKSLPPHSYAVSAYAHKQMIVNKVRQGIVISGESGAGKTESAKQCMAFLTSLGSKNIAPGKPPMGERILSTNPVLEAFGNSRTARNNNSSRFGKYIKLYFDQNDGKVMGAEIKNYLLEKSRVVGCTELERNYHAFFFIMRGCSDERAVELGFQEPGKPRKDFPDFNYMKVCNDLTKKGDIEEYNVLMDSFKSLGFTEFEIDAIHRITAASLHIGELQIDKSTYDDGKNAKPCSIKNQDQLKLVAKLLGIQDHKELEQEIVNKGAMEGISARTPEKPSNVQSTQESLAKQLFDNMFNWLVAKMNIEILPNELKQGDKNVRDEFNSRTKTVGLLDIFGFENFILNQFEQLCINFVNEKLHNLYISSVFGSEKKEMEREGIHVDLVLPELKVLDILKLMDSKVQPLGIFQVVADKSGGTTMGSDDPVKKCKDMYNMLLKNHETVNKDTFKKMRNTTKFTICHSAKDVIYETKNFIDRNSDSMSSSLDKLLKEKTNPTVKSIYSMKTGFEIEEEEPDDPKAKKRGPAIPKTIWGKFSIQIEQLMNELAEPLIPKDLNSKEDTSKQPVAKAGAAPVCEKCDLHFIRCLKPNDMKIKDFFAHAMTLQQITYMGVLESIKVKQENFPYRKKYEDFYRIYELLSPAYVEGRYDLMSAAEKSSKKWDELAKQIMDRVFVSLQKPEYEHFFAFGRTKILKMGEIRAVLQACRQKASAKYDVFSRQIKRSFLVSKANDEILLKKYKLMKIQRFIKKTYKKMQLKRANELQEKIKLAIVAFKTEKRKDFETEAAEIIEKTYVKHKFRDHLNQAIISRQFMMKGIFDLASINRCRKMWICRRMVMKIFDKSFFLAKRSKEQEQAYRIQRILRGHMERNGKEKLVLEAVISKVELKQHVAAKKIQKKLKGLVVRRSLDTLSKKVAILQATMKMKWTRRVYRVIRKNVIILQKAYRRYMARRDQIKVRLYNYLAQELQIIENVKAMEYSQLHGNNLNRSQAQQMGLLKTLTPYSIKKIHFFTRVIDLDILVDLSEIYTHPWSAQWIKALSENTISDNPIMSVQTGQTHSMAVNSKGRVFVWGWNDNGQCAKNSQINEVIMTSGSSIKNAQLNLDHVIDRDKQLVIQNQGGMRIKQAITCQDRCFLLIQETNEILVWGGNYRGQLGLGHYEDVFQPQKLESLSKPDIKINYIAAGGDLNLACSEQGEAFAWPFIQNGLKQSIPTRMPFSEKTKIVKVSCGHNFGFFISNQGLVYSFGEDNSDGQLGLGHIYPTEFPELIQCFRDIGERIDTIECGFKHAIARSTLGKIYTWGSSNKGQLGHGHFDSELSPRPLYIDRKNNKKVAQIAAGYSHCIVMMEQNKEIYWFGNCGSLQQQSTPMLFDFQRYLPDLFGPQHSGDVKPGQGADQLGSFTPYIIGSQQQDFAIMKVNSSWSKTMSVTTMVIADLRAVNQDIPHQKLISSLKNLGEKWDTNDIMPPYIEFIAGLFPANIMKKPAIIVNSKGKNGHPTNQNQTMRSMKSHR